MRLWLNTHGMGWHGKISCLSGCCNAWVLHQNYPSGRARTNHPYIGCPAPLTCKNSKNWQEKWAWRTKNNRPVNRENLQCTFLYYSYSHDSKQNTDQTTQMRLRIWVCVLWHKHVSSWNNSFNDQVGLINFLLPHFILFLMYCASLLNMLNKRWAPGH